MEQEAPNRASGILGDTLAFAGSLERLVMDFEKLRGQALRNARLNRTEVHLLRLAARPHGVGLGQFRDQLGVTDQRASQIARALEGRHLLKRSRGVSDARLRLVSATGKGREALVKFDAQLAEALQADMVKGDDSLMQAALAAIRLSVVRSDDGADEHEDRERSRTSKGHRHTGARGKPLGFWKADGTLR